MSQKPMLCVLNLGEEDAARMKTRLEAYRDKSLMAQWKAEIKRFAAWRRREKKLLLAEIRAHADLLG